MDTGTAKRIRYPVCGGKTREKMRKDTIPGAVFPSYRQGSG